MKELQKKNRIETKKKQERGITLIALVITIIVLLILAGVSIAMLTGKNGILIQAQRAKNATENAQEIEEGRLDEYNNFLNNAIGGTTTGEETTEVSVINYGDKVNYVSQKEETEGINLTWRIFYDDENYVYLISSKQDGSNTVDSCVLYDYISNYETGSEAVQQDLRYLNSKWYETLGDTPSTYSNAKAVAYLMDQNIWSEYKDSTGNASYAIGGPTLELFRNSYNATAVQNSRPNQIEIDCKIVGYEITSIENLSVDYNNGIYNNGTSSKWWLASPYGKFQFGSYMYYVSGNSNQFSNGVTSDEYGLRPVVIIPKSNFKYKIIPET